MTQADGNVVFDARGDVCVSSCTNCPFLTDHMGPHCVLKPEIDMAPIWKRPDHLPEQCRLRPGGLEVRLDFNRKEMLEAGDRFHEYPTTIGMHNA